MQRDRTLTLDGVAFEVDAALVGERVTLRFDPARNPNSGSSRAGGQTPRSER